MLPPLRECARALDLRRLVESLGSEPIAAEYSTTPPPGIVRTALRMIAASA